MHVETFRRETTKKIMGLTVFPQAPDEEGDEPVPVYIAKGLDMMDFVGMIFVYPANGIEGGYSDVVTIVTESRNHSSIAFHTGGGQTYNYIPSTGALIRTE